MGREFESLHRHHETRGIVMRIYRVIFFCLLLIGQQASADVINFNIDSTRVIRLNALSYELVKGKFFF